ncbi:efflux RND transporter periplasmic adaptor subunit [Methylocystis bryophila]|uniref:Efflux transporter periplasmic adaptor subunit n=1 Tax=Methylocystis bryophila TaxID=655015 RepID=A0A1W6MSC1_9HYPH|nr:efflux RND transporter periplasmic adaptor subunit [Methylocystis bryophila]ARN80455.1 efflux transporter periplasmic adaptor subunit [Methylocystis bryophila]BDV40471.1 RND transporter MFP subunit [Methylocystis bryophila]
MSHHESPHLRAPDPAAQAELLRKLRPKALIALGVILTLAAFGVFQRRARDAELARVTREAAIPTVELCAPALSTAAQELVLPANVEAFVDAPIYARVNGYLKSWSYDIGARVKAGDILGVIEAPDLNQQAEQAKGLLARSKAEQNLAHATAKRWTALRNEAAVSAQSADEKTSNLEAATASQNAAQANLDQINTLKAYLNLAAPFDGVVTARNVDVGALIDAGAGRRELFRVADIHKMRIYVRAPQAYAAKIAAGLTARLTLPQYPTREFAAKIVTTANAIAASSRTLLVQFQADNPDGALLPGAFGQIRIALPPKGAPLLLPASALIFVNASPQVATVDEAGVVRMKNVTIARDLGVSLEISAGLSATDRVIRTPWQSVHDGTVVRIKDPKTKEADAR